MPKALGRGLGGGAAGDDEVDMVAALEKDRSQEKSWVRNRVSDVWLWLPKCFFLLPIYLSQVAPGLPLLEVVPPLIGYAGGGGDWLGGMSGGYAVARGNGRRRCNLMS